ncbi:MAG: type II toxin-antitoxin system prevent-host-death family antitoxin [Candidatus Adlerbacteria bacterium]|nr:type II toxin-antitoxin system prevent-host-death family antitoxin [Candidatus Adlerbacteria bacterium]
MNTKSTKQTTVGLKELRENMEKYIDAVDKGDSITVFRRSTPIFRLMPVDSEEMGWETVIDFTEINKNGVSGRDVLAALKKLDG